MLCVRMCCPLIVSFHHHTSIPLEPKPTKQTPPPGGLSDSAYPSSGRIETPMITKVKETISAASLGPKSAFPPVLPRKGEPGEVAALIAFLLGDESRFITGPSYRIDGG